MAKFDREEIRNVSFMALVNSFVVWFLHIGRWGKFAVIMILLTPFSLLFGGGDTTPTGDVNSYVAQSSNHPAKVATKSSGDVSRQHEIEKQKKVVEKARDAVQANKENLKDWQSMKQSDQKRLDEIQEQTSMGVVRPRAQQGLDQMAYKGIYNGIDQQNIDRLTAEQPALMKTLKEENDKLNDLQNK